jgi:hypothetical protein
VGVTFHIPELPPPAEETEELHVTYTTASRLFTIIMRKSVDDCFFDIPAHDVANAAEFLRLHVKANPGDWQATALANICELASSCGVGVSGA